MSIFEVRHQRWAQVILQSAIGGDRIPHAYLFHGPDGIGKETLARAYAQLLLCEKPVCHNECSSEYAPDGKQWFDSCGLCSSCRLMETDSHPDYHLIHRRLIRFHDDPSVRARKGLDLGIDVIRQFVLDAAHKKPALGSRKVFVLRETEKLTSAAQNALLKTLEEPPPGTFLILICRALDSLLPTTRSRCRSIPFSPLPISFVHETLQGRHSDINADLIRFAAALGEGSLGRSVQCLENGLNEINRNVITPLKDLSVLSALEWAHLLEDQADQLAHRSRLGDEEINETDAVRQALTQILTLVATFYDDVLKLTHGQQERCCNTADLEIVRQAGSRMKHDWIPRSIGWTVQAEAQIHLNANTTLCLENLAMRLAHLYAPSR